MDERSNINLNKHTNSTSIATKTRLKLTCTVKLTSLLYTSAIFRYILCYILMCKSENNKNSNRQSKSKAQCDPKLE